MAVVKRLGGVLAACGTTAALLAPAAISAANDPQPPSSEVPGTTGPAAPATTTPAQIVNRPPLALLSARPSAATARKPVALDASASSDPDGSIARYEWDLDGDGSYETDGGATPVIEHTFDTADTREVGLRVTDDVGATSDGLLSLDVAAAPTPTVVNRPAPSAASPPSSSPSPSASPPSPPSPPSPASSSASPASSSASPAVSSRRRDSSSAADPPVARAAATTSVTISDFKFSPGTITVNAGDTVRWTNAGPTGHSATGSGFDTGILAKGASGSETFSKAGTFSYICTPHPFMKGTVVVKAAGSGGSASGGSASSGSGSSGSGSTDSSATDPFGSSGSSAASASGASLPTTGTNVVLVAAIGAGFLVAGLALRLAPRPRRRGG